MLLYWWSCCCTLDFHQKFDRRGVSSNLRQLHPTFTKSLPLPAPGRDVRNQGLPTTSLVEFLQASIWCLQLFVWPPVLDHNEKHIYQEYVAVIFAASSSANNILLT